MRNDGAALALILILAACGPAADRDSPERGAQRLRPTAAPRFDPLAGQPDASGRRWIQVYLFLEGPSVIEALRSGAGQPLALAAPDQVAASRSRLQALEAQHARLRPRLQGLGVRVAAELKRVANAIQVDVLVDRLDALRRLPGVTRIAPVSLFRISNSRAVPHLGAPELWTADTPLQGDGIRIGIIDSGIDYTHATFGGPGTPGAFAGNDPLVVEPGSFPTERVDGVDLVGDAYDPEDPDLREPVPDGDPLDCEGIGHGTHVAGIAAGGGARASGAPYLGPYEMSLDPFDFAVGPGVAPRAKIYALKVTGCGGSSSHIALALEWAADPDGDGDLSDRLDVVNLSMGASFGAVADEEFEMAARLIEAGCVFVAAAGNEGNGYAPFFTLSGPSSLVEAISVGATLKDESRFLALSVSAPGDIVDSFPAAEASFSMPLAQAGAVSAELALVEPELGCSALTHGDRVAGKIALVRRGECTFVEKFGHAEDAGAAALVVVDNVERDTPWPMAGNGFSSLPGVLIRRADGDRLAAWLESGIVHVTLDASVQYPWTVGPDYMVDFSSRGPAATHGMIKPDLSAPGAGITSARVASGFRGVDQSGTSMASPMAAGAAALVRQARPDFYPGQVKAAMINTAAPVRTLDGHGFPVSLAGAGRVDVAAAATQGLLVRAESPPGAISVSFGAIVAAEPLVEERTLRLDNRGAEPVAIEAAIEPDRELPGVSLSIEPRTMTLQPGESGQATLSLALDPRILGQPGPDALTPAIGAATVHRHFLVEASGRVGFEYAGSELASRLPYHAVVRAAARRSADVPAGCAARADEITIDVPLAGGSAHPEPAVSAFQLLFRREGAEPDPDRAAETVMALGVATDLGTARNFDLATVYFGVALGGDWVAPSGEEWSVISLLVDTNLDGEPEYLVDTRAYRPDGMDGAPVFSDAPVVRVIDLGDWELTADDAVLNMVHLDVLDTQLYYNRVAVLPVPLYCIGVDADDTVIAVAAQAGLDSENGEQPAYREFDLAALALDTASRGLEGTDRLGHSIRMPLFGGDGPITIGVDPVAAGAELPDLLLLHHSNAEQRFEVVELPDPETMDSGNLRVVVTPPDAAHAGRVLELEFEASNEGSSAREQVRLEASVDGVLPRSASASAGACEVGATVICDLGTLAADASATVTLKLEAPSSYETATASFEVAVSSSSTCESDYDDNSASGTIAIAGMSPPRRVTDAGCQAVSGRDPIAVLLLLGLVLLALRRAR